MPPLICRLGEWWLWRGEYYCQDCYLRCRHCSHLSSCPHLPSGHFLPEFRGYLGYLHRRDIQQRGPGAPPRFPKEPWDQHGTHRPGLRQGLHCIRILCLPRWNLDWITTVRSRWLCAYIEVFFRRYRCLVNAAVFLRRNRSAMVTYLSGRRGGPAGNLIPKGMVIQA